MLRLRSLMNSYSSEQLLEKVRPYFPDLNLTEDSLKPVDWASLEGKWYEVARSPNDFQNDCGGSMFCFTKSNELGHCNQLCYTRSYYTDEKVTRQSKGLLVPDAIIPFAASMRCGKVANYSTLANVYILWSDCNNLIWFTPTGNIWILSRHQEISHEELNYIVSHLPTTGAKCRVRKVSAKVPESCCNE